MSYELFQKEEAVIAAAQRRLDSGQVRREDREAYAELLQSYQKLLKTTRRLVRAYSGFMLRRRMRSPQRWPSAFK